jgi:hypothetical protein
MRSKLFRLLVFPIAIMLWLIGWVMFYMGSEKEQKIQKAKTAQESKSITIIPILPEEIEEET